MSPLDVHEFMYDLPAGRIAERPLPIRDQARLLVYRSGMIEHHIFHELPQHLPQRAVLYFNDTRVIPARLHFTKDTGATIEIFLLAPVAPYTLVMQAMETTQSCTWQCTIGNLKRWKDNTPLQLEHDGMVLTAQLTDRAQGLVTFTWTPSHLSFAEVLHRLGAIPLPPYIKRKADAADAVRYQTIYSHHDGAVAAPTAGLHFTDDVFKALDARGITKEFLTLHVSAGTFQPIKETDALRHTMHNEQVVVAREVLVRLQRATQSVIAVGTTSMRTLESLYWFGVNLLENSTEEFTVSQTDPYITRTRAYTTAEALQAVIDHLDAQQQETLIGNTSIYIHPGYQFRVVKGLITNFHRPGSTLMLLVAAFIGEQWKTVYQQALNNEYRFLSYGDSSLLLP